MSKINYIYLVIILVFVGVYSAVYIVDEREQAVVTEFGKPVKTVTEAGFYFKIPFIQKVMKFDKRVLEWDGAANEIPTNDNKYIYVDTFARWKISDPLQFYKATKDESNAQSRIDDIIDGAVRDEISTRYMPEIIRSSDRINVNNDEVGEVSISGARHEIMQNIYENVSVKTNIKFVCASDEKTSCNPDGDLSECPDSSKDSCEENSRYLNLGIEVLDIQIKRLSYTSQVQQKLFARMISEQLEIAEEYRAKGQGIKLEILGNQIKREKEILSEAYRTAQEIKGTADAVATRIYANAYGQDPGFYAFYKTLETYKKTLDPSTVFILSTDSKYLKFLEN